MSNRDATVVVLDIIPILLPWVHIAISNAKRLLLDVHKKLKNEYLLYYLNEYCYKFNRRYFGDKIFGRLLITAVSLLLILNLKFTMGLFVDKHIF